MLDVFEEGLRRGGATIVSRPAPSVAPFEYTILTASGERLRLIAYLFRALPLARASGRRRQLDGDAFHRWLHLDAGILVGCDPAMHNPTWFSKSVEFKDEHLELARETGWHG